MTTTDITSADIEALRTESAKHGDLANSGMCAIALGDEPTAAESEALAGFGIEHDAFSARREAFAQIREIRANLVTE